MYLHIGKSALSDSNIVVHIRQVALLSHSLYQILHYNEILFPEYNLCQRARRQDFEMGGTTLDIIKAMAAKRPKSLRLL